MKERNMIKSYLKKFLTVLLAVALVLSSGAPAMEVQAGSDTTVIRSNGRTFYLKTYRRKDYREKACLYQQTSKGKKLVAKTGYSYYGMSYAFSYDKKLYFNYQESDNIKVYSYTIGKSGFKRERNNLLLLKRYGSYALGYSAFPRDISPKTICIYNLRTKKVKVLGKVYDPKFIDCKIYYAKLSKDLKTAYIMRCNPNGSGQKVLKKIRSRYCMFGFTVGKHRATYGIMVSNGRAQSRSVRY